ncbi:MAG: hypothetical protein AAFX41_16910 [Bacteroidota bacterium]
MKAFALLFTALLFAGPALAQDTGIHVAGHWTLDVYNADGTLDESRAFHNDLVLDGGSLLVRLLARDAEHGAFQLRIRGVDGPLCGDDSSRSPCTLAEPGTIADDPEDPLDDLTLEIINRNAANGNPTVLRLSGRAVIGFAGQIGGVSSQQYYCQYDEVDLCGPETAGFLRDFTERTFDVPLDVEAGQTVDVTFELSFE